MPSGVKFFNLLHTTSRSSNVNLTRPFFYNPIKNYGESNKGNHGRLMEERAPSIAEEFERVAEEKVKETEKGVASQTLDKAYDGAEEAIAGSKAESVKDRYKEHEPQADYRKRD